MSAADSERAVAARARADEVIAGLPLTPHVEGQLLRVSVTVAATGEPLANGFVSYGTPDSSPLALVLPLRRTP